MSEPRLTDSEIDAAEWNLHNGLLPDVDIIADLRATRAELATLRGVVRDAVGAIALAEHVDLRELGYVVTRGVTDESPQSWWDSQSWPIYHAIVSLVALSQEAQ